MFWLHSQIQKELCSIINVLVSWATIYSAIYSSYIRLLKAIKMFLLRLENKAKTK